MNAGRRSQQNREYELLDAIAADSLVTQAGLSTQLGIAVGSVNWYIKRLIRQGYVKVSHLSRTRLRYHLTAKGMAVFTERALQYARNSLSVYRDLRIQAKTLVAELKQRKIERVCLDGDDETMDILQLTCIEAGLHLERSAENSQAILRTDGPNYRFILTDAARGDDGS